MAVGAVLVNVIAIGTMCGIDHILIEQDLLKNKDLYEEMFGPNHIQAAATWTEKEEKERAAEEARKWDEVMAEGQKFRDEQEKKAKEGAGGEKKDEEEPVINVPIKIPVINLDKNDGVDCRTDKKQ